MTSPLQQKMRMTGPVVITANRLDDGVVVYRTVDGRWSTALAEAVVVRSAPRASELLSAAGADGLAAVGAYAAPVACTNDGSIRPGNLRERIRHEGPTVGSPLSPRG